MTNHSTDKKSKQKNVKNDRTPMASPKMRRAKSGWALYQTIFRQRYPKKEYDFYALSKIFPKHKNDANGSISKLRALVWGAMNDSVKSEFKNIAGSEKPPRSPSGNKISMRWNKWRDDARIDEYGDEINGPVEKLVNYIQ